MSFINFVWRFGKLGNEWPVDWTKSVFIPLPKKGDLSVCSNYRTRLYHWYHMQVKFSCQLLWPGSRIM